MLSRVEGRGPIDDDLIERARWGDVAAYEDLVKRYQSLAFRVAYLIVGEAAGAEDAAQEAFVKAYYALSRFRPGAAFRPWLLQIVANEAHNRRRADSRRTRLAWRASEQLIAASTDPSPEVLILAAERERQLLAALDELREEERLAIVYRYFLDCSEAEIAALLGCARGTVKSRLARALARLRRLLSGGAAGEKEADRE